MKMLRAKLLEREEARRREEIAAERGEAQDVNFGSQIRSYVLHPYTMVKDHRTNFEVGDAQRRARRRPRRLRPRRAHAHRPATHDRAAGRALPRRRDRLRDPRSRALPRARPQGRPGRRPRPALRPRRPRAVARHPAGHLGRRPRAVADALRGGRAPRRRGPRRRADVVPDQRRDAGQPRAVPGARAARRARRRPAQLARLARRRARALRRRARLRAARVRRGAGHGARRRAGRAGAPRWPRTPDARAAFIVSPTYYGMAADVGGVRRGGPRGRRRRSSSTSRGARTSASTRRCRRARCRRAPTPCSPARTRSRAR